MRDIKTLLELLLDQYENNPDDKIRSDGLCRAINRLTNPDGVFDPPERLYLLRFITLKSKTDSKRLYEWPKDEVEFLKQLIFEL